MKTKIRTRNIALAFLAGLLLVVDGVWWLNSNRAAPESSETVVHAALVIYACFDDAVKQHGTAVLITVVSDPVRYEDFGADGKPDYAGQPGLPTEHLTVRIDEVLRGDAGLVGSEITVSQLPKDSGTTLEQDGYLEKGSQYVIIASAHKPNPGVGTAAEVWSMPLAGQGIFKVDAAGQVTPFVAGVFPETFGAAGEEVVTTADLKG